MPGKPAELRRCNCVSGKGFVSETEGPVLGTSSTLQGTSSELPSDFSQHSPGKRKCLRPLLQATDTTRNVSLFKPPRSGPRYPHRAQLYGERERNSEQRHSKCETKADTASGLLGTWGLCSACLSSAAESQAGPLAVPGPA